MPGRPPPPQGETQVFPNFQSFQPQYSPRTMLEQGVFGGAFFNSSRNAIGIPPSLFFNLPFVQYSAIEPVGSNNITSYLVPQRRRDMNIPNPLRRYHVGGWFQWYCSFFFGERCAADKWRIDQWINEVNTIYGEYVKTCTAQSWPVGQWLLDGDTPPDEVKFWIQTLFEISWDFSNETLPV